MNNKLLFLCGFPSSGTDLLKNIINSHAKIYINGEFPLLPYLDIGQEDIITPDTLDETISKLKEIDVLDNFENLGETISPGAYSLSEIYSLMLNDKPVEWKGNKTPQNTEHIARLKQMFPKAKFILIVRDVRDVALSWHNKWGKNELLCASKWNHRMKKGYNSLKGLDENDYLILKYENVLSDLDTITSRICIFLGLAYDQKMVQFHKHVKDTRIGKINYGKKLVKDNKQKWQNQMPQARIRRIEEVAYESLQLFGYPITVATTSRPLTRSERYMGISHDVMATVFVGNRAIKQDRAAHTARNVLFEVQKYLKQRRGKR